MGAIRAPEPAHRTPITHRMSYDGWSLGLFPEYCRGPVLAIVQPKRSGRNEGEDADGDEDEGDEGEGEGDDVWRTCNVIRSIEDGSGSLEVADEDGRTYEVAYHHWKFPPKRRVGRNERRRKRKRER